jgi:predicted glycoside hydrolase/deacetylase ChbG (UPF0249 family)
MVFMEDSMRAADLAGESGIDVGLHLNFTQKLTQRLRNQPLSDYHDRITGFLTRNRYNFLVFNPMLRKQFEYVYRAQLEEFVRLYGGPPSHIDGHHHMHLCANVLVDGLIPKGQKIRRNFTFALGEKNLLNRTYRSLIDRWLARRYIITDHLFSLSELIQNGKLERALELAKTSSVELETHPELAEELKWLMGNAYTKAVSNLQTGTYSML